MPFRRQLKQKEYPTICHPLKPEPSGLALEKLKDPFSAQRKMPPRI
jgi:hypothetical protein